MQRKVVDELHALLWSMPRTNNGVFDAGWNCRDHSLVVAAFKFLSGEVSIPYIVHGKSMLVLGPSYGNNPAGFGQDSKLQEGHTWNLSANGAIYDYSLSVPRGKKHQEWRRVKDPIIEEGSCRNLKAAEVIESSNRRDYEGSIAVGSKKEDGFRICYLPVRRERFSPKMLLKPFQWLDSPLSNKMHMRYDETIYVKIVMHLLDFAHGRTKSIAHKSQIGAWNTVARRSDEEVDFYAQHVCEMYTDN